jgi:hypothetical protein
MEIAQRNPRFAAIDRAIGRDSFKVRPAARFVWG